MENQLPQKPKKIREVYLDNAATTQVDDAVFDAMKPYFEKKFGNASSLHKKGIEIEKDLMSARNTVANFLGAQVDTVFFTGSGTESCNLAILGIAREHKHVGKHIIATKIEHHAVIEPLIQLEREGFDVTYLPVNEQGVIDIKNFKEALRPDTILVTIMFANNEIGSIQPIAEIGKEILKWRKGNATNFPYFHSDACQGTLTEDLKVESLHVDLLTINSIKIFGPKGVGVLYKRRGLNMQPLTFGGGQEGGVRPGTENIPGIIGMSTAIELIGNEKKYLEELRNYFWDSLKEKIESTALNGPTIDSNERLVTNLSVSFEGVEADKLILYLDAYGIYASAGSACTAKKTEVSHVLDACGFAAQRANSTVRFTLGKYTTKKDIDYVMMYLPEIVKALRGKK